MSWNNVARVPLCIIAMSTVVCAQPQVQPLSNPEVKFDDQKVRSVHLFHVDNAKNIQLANSAIINDQVIVSGTLFDGEESRLWVASITQTGGVEWSTLLDPMRHNVDHLHSCGIFAYQRPFARNTARMQSAVVIRRGVDTGLRLISQSGKVVRKTEIGRLEKTAGSLWLSEEELYMFGTGSLRPEAIGNAWVARFDEHGHVRWKYPVLFDGLPSEVEGTVRNPDEQPYGGGGIAGGIRLADETLLFAGAHRYSNSKFGTGPSDLFLIRITPEGQELDRHLIEDRRLCSSPGIVEVDGAIFLVSTLQGFGAAMREGYEIKLTRFEQNLDPVWEKDVQTSSKFSFGFTALLSTGDQEKPILIASPVSEPNLLVLRLSWYDVNGQVVDQTEVRMKDAVTTTLRSASIHNNDAILTVQCGRTGFAVIRVPLSGQIE